MYASSDIGGDDPERRSLNDGVQFRVRIAKRLLIVVALGHVLIEGEAAGNSPLNEQGNTVNFHIQDAAVLAPSLRFKPEGLAFDAFAGVIQPFHEQLRWNNEVIQQFSRYLVAREAKYAGESRIDRNDAALLVGGHEAERDGIDQSAQKGGALGDARFQIRADLLQLLVALLNLFQHLIELRVEVADLVIARRLGSNRIIFLNGNREGRAGELENWIRNRLLEPGADDQRNQERGEQGNAEHQGEAFFPTGNCGRVGFEINDSGGMLVDLYALEHNDAIPLETGLIAGCRPGNEGTGRRIAAVRGQHRSRGRIESGVNNLLLASEGIQNFRRGLGVFKGNRCTQIGSGDLCQGREGLKPGMPRHVDVINGEGGARNNERRAAGDENDARQLLAN